MRHLHLGFNAHAAPVHPAAIRGLGRHDLPRNGVFAGVDAP